MVFSEEREFVGAAVILQGGAGIGLAGFGGKLLEIRHDAGHIYLGGLFLAFAIGHEDAQVIKLAVAEVVYLKAVAVQRMRAQVHAHQLLFLLQDVQDVHFPFEVRQGRAFRLHFLHVSEQGHAAREAVCLDKFSVTDNLVDKQLPASSRLEVHAPLMPQAVQGAGIHQVLETLAVHAAGHALHKVINVCEQAVFLALLHDGLHHVGAKALDGPQGKTHISVLVHGKVTGALVHIRA